MQVRGRGSGLVWSGKGWEGRSRGSLTWDLGRQTGGGGGVQNRNGDGGKPHWQRKQHIQRSWGGKKSGSFEGLKEACVAGAMNKGSGTRHVTGIPGCRFQRALWEVKALDCLPRGHMMRLFKVCVFNLNF